jgi:ATP-binding cassette subfamily B protein
MFTYYWKLALVILLVIPFYALIYFILNKFNKKKSEPLWKRSRIANTIGRVLPYSYGKKFGIEEFSNLKTENRFVKLLFTYKSGLNSIFAGTSTQFLASIFTVF